MRERRQNDDEFLRLIFGLIKNDGKIYITVPAYNFLWSKEDEYAGHFRRYTGFKITKLLEKIGFKIVFNSYIFSPLLFPVFLFRTLPSLVGLKVGGDKKENIKDHSAVGFKQKIIDVFLSRELKKIKTCKKLKFGTSCLIVAEKKNDRK